MSDREQDVRTSFDEADVHSVYASPEGPFFSIVNDSSPTCERNDLEEAEETYFTPVHSDKFLQWRQMDRSPNESPFTPVKTMLEEGTPEASACDESLIEQVHSLSLSTPREPRASTPTKDAEASVNASGGSPAGRGIREDLLERISRIEEKPQAADRDKTKDETSDYSSVESTLPENNGSSKVTSGGAVDQLPPRGTGQSDRPCREDAVGALAKPKTTGSRNLVNAESTRLADHSATSFGKPDVIRDCEVFETDTFDDLYSRNVELAQHYVKQMIKEQEGGCFGSNWSRKIMTMSTLCRSPQRAKKSKEREVSAGGARTSSPVRESAKPFTDALEDSIIKLRFGRRKKQVQIPDRSRSGKHVSRRREMVDR